MVCVLVVVLFRLRRCRDPPPGLSCLLPLYHVNPFALDQFIEIWCRGALGDVYTFVLLTTAIDESSWVDWDVVGSCCEKLWLAWVELSQKRPTKTKLEKSPVIQLRFICVSAVGSGDSWVDERNLFNRRGRDVAHMLQESHPGNE